MMSSKFLKPCLTKSTTIVKYNRFSLVDIHFVNIYDKEVPSGNIICDHLPNFVIIKNTRSYKNKNLKLEI